MKRTTWVKGALAIGVSGMLLFFGSEGFSKSSDASQQGSRFIQKFDKDADGKISSAEFMEHFKVLDKNGDGFIEASEAPKGGWHHHGRMSGDFIKKFDKDGDGKVSKAEFPGREDRFSQIDKNGDGFIDSSEVPQKPAK